MAAIKLFCLALFATLVSVSCTISYAPAHEPVFASAPAPAPAPELAPAPAPSSDSPVTTLIVVDQSGDGDFTTIQDAIDAVPPNNVYPFFILIKPGVYKERVVVPAEKPFITLSGMNSKSTIITGDKPQLTVANPTVSVLASDVVVRYLTIQNTYNLTREAAVALRVASDKVAFYACRFIGIQDTVHDVSGRHYYSNCYFEGATDFICGNGKSLFENCTIYSVSKLGGSITAHRREHSREDTYFVFLRCKVTGVEGGRAILGRPWGPFSTVVYANSNMSSIVLPQGWSDWVGQNRKWTTYFAEYKCHGPGANLLRRVKWAHTLSKAKAAVFLDKSHIIGPKGHEWTGLPPRTFKKFVRGGN